MTISRRTLLRGVGTTLALPWLEAMGPLAAWADATSSLAPGGRGQGEGVAPNRMAFIYVPNGKHMAAWTPRK